MGHAIWLFPKHWFRAAGDMQLYCIIYIGMVQYTGEKLLPIALQLLLPKTFMICLYFTYIVLNSTNFN